MATSKERLEDVALTSHSELRKLRPLLDQSCREVEEFLVDRLQLSGDAGFH